MDPSSSTQFVFIGLLKLVFRKKKTENDQHHNEINFSGLYHPSRASVLNQAREKRLYQYQ